jgi:2-polyprenyl-3-methyl-5-hydroxy-6-metoxy-1,4-benzoquinol methylase
MRSFFAALLRRRPRAPVRSEEAADSELLEWRAAVARGNKSLEAATTDLTAELAEYFRMAEAQVQRVMATSSAGAWVAEEYDQAAITRHYKKQANLFIIQNAKFSLNDPSFKLRLQAIRHFQSRGCECALDYGCGAGATAIAMKMLGLPTVYAADIAEKYLLFVAHRARIRGIEIKTLNLEHQIQERFSGILVFDVFNIIEDPSVLVKRMRGLTLPNGCVACNLRTEKRADRKWLIGAVAKDIIDCFEETGFRVTTIEEHSKTRFCIFEKQH